MDRKVGERAGTALVGFILIGLALGIMFNQTVVGILAGLALGFIGWRCWRSARTQSGGLIRLLTGLRPSNPINPEVKQVVE